MRKMLLAGLGFALALPAAAQTEPQQAVTQELEQAGFTNIQNVPGAFVLRATDRAGRSVTMIIDPSATPPLPPAVPSLTTAAPAASAANALTDREKQFLIAAAQSSNYELALSNLAISRASAPEVKQFAQEAVGSHDAFDRALQDVAKAVGMPLPQTPSADQQAQLATFVGLASSSFDHTYLQEMARIETLNSRALEMEASATRQPALSSFAQTFAADAAKRAHEALVLNVTP